MTTSRIVRGSKAKIFLYVCTVLIITGIIACFNNTLSQLDDVKKAFEVCHQEQENLSTQLQMISDYKQRLEKSLKTEKAEHQQALKELRAKVNDEQAKNEKTSVDAKMKFASLQQHYSLLQTQHDDLKEKCSDIQQQQLSEINNLQAKLKEVQEHAKHVESNHENLKSEYMQLLDVKKNLEEQVKNGNANSHSSQSELNHLTKENHQLLKEVEELKNKCPGAAGPLETLQAPGLPSQRATQASSSRNFTKQVALERSSYQIRDMKDKPIDANVADEPPAGKQPSADKNVNNENESVLASPENQPAASPSSRRVSKASLQGVPPLKLPTVTPESVKSRVSKETGGENQNSRVLPLPYQFGLNNNDNDNNKVPRGVVPVKKPEQRQQQPPEDKSIIANDVNEALPNRYRNNIIENELEKEDQNRQLLKGGGALKAEDAAADRENVANEVNDDNLGFADLNDALKHAERQKFEKHHIDAMGLGEDKLANNNNHNNGQGAKLYDAHNEAEYDKAAQNDVQLEENDPEEDDDIDDYGDPHHQKDPAVRN